MDTHWAKMSLFVLSLKTKVDPSLIILLKQILSFNNVVYVPANTLYGPPTDYGHYFDVDDSIVITLLAVKLGEEIKKVHIAEIY